MKTLYFPITIEDNTYNNTFMYKAFFQKNIRDFEETFFDDNTIHSIQTGQKVFRKQLGEIALLTGVNLLDVYKELTTIVYASEELPDSHARVLNAFVEFLGLDLDYKIVKASKDYFKSSWRGPFCNQKFKGLSTQFGPCFIISDNEITNHISEKGGSSCSWTQIGRTFEINPYGLTIGCVIFDENGFNGSSISNDTKCLSFTFTFKFEAWGKPNQLTFYTHVYSQYNNSSQRDSINYLLKNVEPVIPVNPKTYLCRAKFVNYPTSIKLPISIPVDLYDGEKVVKSIDLTKSTSGLYSATTELPDNKTYTAKVNTLKMDKNFLSRTKITYAVSPDKWSTDFTFTCTNTDPYPGGGSEPGGGSDGVMPNPGQTINGVEIPTPPSMSVTDTGLVTLYHPTLSQVKELARVLWKPNFFEKISKMFNNPMDALQGLVQLPIEVGTAGSQELVVGNVGTGINMNVCAQQYIFTTVGTIQVPQKYNSYLDFSPFTKGQIFLPFIGFRPLNIDEVMGDTITVTYQIDILSGACCATLLNSKGLMFANYSGNCATSIALSGRDFSNTIQSAITVATATGVALATGGAGAPALTAAGMSAETASAVSAIGSAGSVAGAVAGSKPSVERSGSCSGSLSMLTTRTPYVLIERPNPCIPSSQNAIDGYPSFITKKLGDCQGLTSVYSCNLELLTNATDTEKSEVLQLLKGGVKI